MLISCLPVPLLYWEFDFQNHGNQTSFSGLGPRGRAANKLLPFVSAEFIVVGWARGRLDRVADATTGNADEDRTTNHAANEE